MERNDLKNNQDNNKGEKSIENISFQLISSQLATSIEYYKSSQLNKQKESQQKESQLLIKNKIEQQNEIITNYGKYGMPISPEQPYGTICLGLTRLGKPCKLSACKNIHYCHVHQSRYKTNCPEECSICMEKMETVTIPTKCSHYFHKSCLKTWLQEHHTCPICRVSLQKPKIPTYRLTSLDHFFSAFVDALREMSQINTSTV